MSAVMSTLSMISGTRRAHRKLACSRKSGQFSDAGEERSRSQHDLHKQQRSASLLSCVGARWSPGAPAHLDRIDIIDGSDLYLYTAGFVLTLLRFDCINECIVMMINWNKTGSTPMKLMFNFVWESHTNNLYLSLLTRPIG
ncbi:unnamed protein product [Spodoptera exigua]|nr:unnamed protein product [Spodoptera exigua]